MSGWRDFQIDLAVAIIDCGIRQDWKNRDQTAKPKKMRQTRVKPCECKRCFFCKNRETTGIYHDRLTVILTSPGSGKKWKIRIKCTCERISLPFLSTGGTIADNVMRISPRLLLHLRRRENARHQEWVVLHV